MSRKAVEEKFREAAVVARQKKSKSKLAPASSPKPLLAIEAPSDVASPVARHDGSDNSEHGDEADYEMVAKTYTPENVRVDHSNAFDLLGGIAQYMEDSTERLNAAGLPELISSITTIVRKFAALEPTSMDMVEEIYRTSDPKDYAEIPLKHDIFTILRSVQERAIGCKEYIMVLNRVPPEAPSQKNTLCICLNRRDPLDYPEYKTLKMHHDRLVETHKQLNGLVETFKQKHWSQPFPALQHTLRANKRGSLV